MLSIHKEIIWVAGFEGVICEQDISICDHQVPCHNDATCVDGVGFTFTCVCLPGYTGEFSLQFFNYNFDCHDFFSL